jgi:hypothetical protein
MPTHYGLELNNREDIEDRWEPSIQLHKEATVAICQPGAAPSLAPQNDQLLSQRRILSFKPAFRLQERRQDGQHKVDQRDHSANIADFVASSIRIGFLVQTGLTC